MIKKLQWDSDFFGFNIAQIDASRADSIEIEFIDKFARDNSIRLIQSLADIDDIRTINSLETNGFHFVDLKTDFKKTITDQTISIDHITEATLLDIYQLQGIVEDLYSNSRYFHELISLEKSRQFYQVWIENAIKKTYDDECFIYKQNNIIEGFISLKYIDKKTARIGLIGVDNNVSSKGVGSKLVTFSEKFLFDKGFEELYVATQGNNTMALNFYIKNGFRISSIKSWYYKFY